jgi:hypothetical protein
MGALKGAMDRRTNMPVRPDLRHFYYGPAWKATRARMLERAGDCCENCGCPRNVSIMRRKWKDYSWEHPKGLPRMAWRRLDSVLAPWWDENGERIGLLPPHARKRAFEKTIRDPLAIAHLNHTAGDDRDENLRALCGWCHLHHDQEHHQETREVRKDSGRPIVQEAKS